MKEGTGESGVGRVTLKFSLKTGVLGFWCECGHERGTEEGS